MPRLISSSTIGTATRPELLEPAAFAPPPPLRPKSVPATLATATGALSLLPKTLQAGLNDPEKLPVETASKTPAPLATAASRRVSINFRERLGASVPVLGWGWCRGCGGGREFLCLGSVRPPFLRDALARTRRGMVNLRAGETGQKPDSQATIRRKVSSNLTRKSLFRCCLKREPAVGLEPTTC